MKDDVQIKSKFVARVLDIAVRNSVSARGFIGASLIFIPWHTLGNTMHPDSIDIPAIVEFDKLQSRRSFAADDGIVFTHICSSSNNMGIEIFNTGTQTKVLHIQPYLNQRDVSVQEELRTYFAESGSSILLFESYSTLEISWVDDAGEKKTYLFIPVQNIKACTDVF